MDLKFRTLCADEIDVRIGSVNRGGVNLLLYKDARCDMSILDEHVGSLNWKREHEVIDGKLFCSVSIYDPEKKEWISKSDVGTGLASGRGSSTNPACCRAAVFTLRSQ